MKDCTIDIWILKRVRYGGDSYHECVLFLETILYRGCKVCIDQEASIFRKYSKLVDYRNPSDFIGRWWKTILLRNLKWVRPRLTPRMRRDFSKLSFREDDWIYVGMANASIDRKIISGDSDFGCNPSSRKNRMDIKACLDTRHSIVALTPQDAVEELTRDIPTSSPP